MQKNRNLRLLTPSSKFCTIIADGTDIYVCVIFPCDVVLFREYVSDGYGGG